MESLTTIHHAETKRTKYYALATDKERVDTLKNQGLYA